MSAMAIAPEAEEKVLKQFKAVVLDDKNSYQNTRSFSDVVEIESELLKRGILFDQKIVSNLFMLYLERSITSAKKLYGVDSIKLNSTFWKDWDYQQEYSVAEQNWHQLLNYVGTYGLGAKVSHTPDADKNLNIPIELAKELTYIKAIARDELKDKVLNMLTSGVALSDDTINDLIVIVKDYKLELTDDELTQIKNKEFLCRMYLSLHIIPKQFDEFTRLLEYAVTDNALLVKNQELYDSFDNQDQAHAYQVNTLVSDYLDKYGEEQMAKNITRYRKLYLIIRKHAPEQLKSELNKVFKLSKKLYEPRPASPLEHIMDSYLALAQIKKSLEGATTFKLVKLYNYLQNVRSDAPHFYRIRNGKGYLKIDASSTYYPVIQFLTRSMLVQQELQDRIAPLKQKYDYVYIPEGISYAVPTSEKEFVGAIPYMSTFTTDGKLIVGMNWTEEVDLDLHAINAAGGHIGWNEYIGSNYPIVYSGDMTSLNRYGNASEYLRFNAQDVNEPVTVMVSVFLTPGRENVPFKIFASAVDEDPAGPKYHAYYDGIITQLGEKTLSADSEMSEGESHTIMTVIPEIGDSGVHELKAVFSDFSFGNMRVPGVNNLTTKIVDAFKAKADKTLMLKELLSWAGIETISDKSIVEDENRLLDLSPSVITPSTFIDMMTGNVDNL